jgi:Na+-driven multidrug efflux pump
MFIVFAFLGGTVGSIFSDDPEVISVTGLYLSIVPIGYGLYGIVAISTSAMSVLKKPIHAAILTLTQAFILYIPMAYVGSLLIGLWGVFLALPVSYLVSSIVAIYTLNRIIMYREKTVKRVIDQKIIQMEA